MADSRSETLAETKRRLEVEQQRAASAPTPAAPPKRKGNPGPIIALVVVAIVVLSIIVAVVAGVSGSLRGEGGLLADDWTSYPGTYDTDPREVLAGESKEEILAKVTALQDEFRDRLRDDYGFIWIQDYEERIEPEDNGYGGTSMFDSYWSADWVGASATQSPTMRADIIALWEELSNEYGGEDFYISNDIYSDDPQSSAEQFGSAVRSKQALWEAANHDDSVHGVTMLVDVFDSTLPTDEDFNGYYQQKVIELDKGVNATVFVTFTVWADHLLPEDDEDAFMDRIGPYLGRDKPDYRS